MTRFLFLFFCFFASFSHLSATPTHGFSVWEQLKYPENFTHYEYANLKAPKRGHLHLGATGRFDSLNPFIVRGDPAPGIMGIYATLLDPSHDEPGAAYAYVAERVEVAQDGMSVTFTLNPRAKFNDGTPITAEDVEFSFDALRTKGFPMYRSYYADVVKVEILNQHQIKFHFKSNKNDELPLILGQVPVMSKAYFKTRKFDEVTLTPPPCSGPYEIEKVESYAITYKLVQDWWGKDIPSQKGRYNFQRMTYDMYRDQNAFFEAFKAGKLDIFLESTASRWKTGYDFPAVEKKWVKKLEIPTKLSSGTYGLVMNTRRPIFKDIRVRKALTLVFDFHWANKNLFYGLYTRNLSYFPNSDYAQKGLPEGLEKKILERFKGRIPEEVLTTPFQLPDYTDNDAQRKYLAEAKKLFEEAGWTYKDEKLFKDGAPCVIEFVIRDKSHERFLQNFVNMLKRIGVTLKIRLVDSTNYQQRVDDLDFDMILNIIGQSNNLGNEQRNFWGSQQINSKGTYNVAGIQDPVIDELIEEIITAKTYEIQVATAKAMDRLLLWGYYMIPAWHRVMTWVAAWDKFGRPDVSPAYHPIAFETWWLDEGKQKDLEAKENAPEPVPSFVERLKTWVEGLFS